MDIYKNNPELTEDALEQVTGGAGEDFDLSIADKEFIVLVGPSGCGKTTTLRLLDEIEEPGP